MAITIEKIIGSSEGNPDTGLTAKNKINSNFQNLADAILNMQITGGSISFTKIIDKPTTLAGYGITDAASVSHVHTFASLTNKPTTLLGYGIVDAALINHTHSFSVLTDKPTTLLGYGITDAYTKSQIDTYLALKLDKTAFNDLFEKVNIGTEANPIYAIEAKYDFYGLGEVSAYGVGSGGSGGGLIQTVYSYSNLGGTYNDSVLTDTFNAYTINQLSSRINSLEGGTALTFNTTGSGNAITSISKTGTVVTSVLGNSYLPLSGGTLSGRLYANITSNSDLGILNREDGNNDNWRGRIISQNATSNKSIFIGTYGNVGGVFSHNFSLDAWDNLYINTLDGTNGGEVRMPPNTYVGNNAVWHYGNLNNLNQLSTRNFSDLQNKPTTLSGYGIVDAANINHTHAFSVLTDKPSTLSGYGITDALLASSYNANDILTKLKTVDGSGSGLDSDTIDGYHASSLYRTDNANLSTVDWNAKDGHFNGSIYVGSSWNIHNQYNYGDIEFRISDTSIAAIARNWTDAINGGLTLKYSNAGVLYDGLLLVSGGDVLIGTSIGNGYKLDVNGTIRGYGIYSDNNWFRSIGNVGWCSENYGGGIYMTDTNYVRVYNGKAFQVDSTADASIKTSGGIQIGSAQLIYNAANNTLRVQKSDGSAVDFYATGGVSALGAGTVGTDSYMNSTLHITGGYNLIADGNISTGGKTGVADGLGGVYISKYGSMEISGGSPFIDFHFGNSIADYTTRLIEAVSGELSVSGKFRIGDTYGDNGSYALHVTGNSYFNGAINSSGAGTFTGGSFSSLRSLKNIHDDWDGSAIDAINAFKVRDFNYKNDATNRTLGFIIDEIPENVAGYILFGKDKDSINLYSLHALSFKAHQETFKRTVTLEDKVAQLEIENASLRNRVVQLEIAC